MEKVSVAGGSVVKDSFEPLFLIVAVLLFLAAVPARAQSAPATCWNLVWSDEFDGTSINTANWNFETGCSAYGNNELENYTTSPANAYLQNGNLVIQAIDTGGGMCGYTSARLTTQGKVHMTYGRIEARIKAPYGQGIWPAFWMLGSDINTNPWPACGEIDIMEMIGGGSGRDNVNYGTAHWNNGGAVQSGSNISIPWPAKLSDDYHVYAIEWNATSITWYFDGTAYYTLSTTPAAMSAFQGKDFYILLNVAVGGTWPGSPDGTTQFPQNMYVDYVRWYQPGTCPATNTPTATPTPTASPTPAATPTGTQTPPVTAVPTPSPTPAFPNDSEGEIYPNPARGDSVELLPPAHSGTEDVRVGVYTVAFRKALERTFSGLPPGGAANMELKDWMGNPLPNGLYYVAVSAGSRRSIVKLLVIR